MISDELIEIGNGELAPQALLAVTHRHIAERAGSDVAVERSDRDAELGCGFGLRAQAIIGPRPALPLDAICLAVPTQFADVLQVRLDLFHAVMEAPVVPVVGPQPIVFRLGVDENFQGQFDLIHPLREVDARRPTRVGGNSCGMGILGHGCRSYGALI